jgi:hypothetical protein
MKILRLIPVLVGVAILLFGIYLVSTGGYVGSTYLPSLIGIQPCNSNSLEGPSPNGSDCTGFSTFGAFGVGTIVCIFGLGIIASTVRRAMATSSSGSSTLPPNVAAAWAQAQVRMPPVSGTSAPGPKPGTIYCSKCGAANPAEAKFCHQCASPMPRAPTTGPPPSQPTGPPGPAG